MSACLNDKSRISHPSSLWCERYFCEIKAWRCLVHRLLMVARPEMERMTREGMDVGRLRVDRCSALVCSTGHEAGGNPVRGRMTVSNVRRSGSRLRTKVSRLFGRAAVLPLRRITGRLVLSAVRESRPASRNWTCNCCMRLVNCYFQVSVSWRIDHGAHSSSSKARIVYHAHGDPFVDPRCGRETGARLLGPGGTNLPFSEPQ